MKQIIVLIWFFFPSLHIAEGLSIQKITYRDWKDCYEIRNEKVRVVINASSGGRIMVYERNGINVIYENPIQNGKLLHHYEEKPFDPDGGRFDVGPVSITAKLNRVIFLGEWEAEVPDNGILELKSKADSLLGLQIVRTFQLDSLSSQLSIHQTMINISKTRKEYFFWGRTLVKPDGMFIIRLNAESNFSAGWGRYIWGDPVRFEQDSLDPGVKIRDGFFFLNPMKAANQKYGFDNEDGWMGYFYRSLFFLKEYKYEPGGFYSEQFGLTNVVYVKKKTFAELEPISATAILEPGQSFSFTENWYLKAFDRAEHCSGIQSFIEYLYQ